MKKRILGAVFGAAMLVAGFVATGANEAEALAADKNVCGTYGEVGPISACVNACVNCVITIPEQVY